MRKEPLSSGSFHSWPSVALQIAVVLVAIQVFLVHPTAGWVETYFINGYYPALERALSFVSSRVWFPVGDMIALLGALCVFYRAQVWWRHSGAKRARAVRFGLESATVAALYAICFYAMWGWCYDRAPLTERVAYDSQRVNAQSVQALVEETTRHLNELAALAHRSERNPDLRPVAADVQNVVAMLGNQQPIVFPEPKRSLLDWYLTATGIGGYINPYSAEDIAASDILWFERPDFAAHEWAHSAGFAREDEANYIAVLACLRSKDPVVQYSAWLQIYLYIHPPHIGRGVLVPEVWTDFAAITARNQNHVNVDLSKFQWRFYNSYLHANKVKSGTVSYSQFVNLLIGIPR